MSCDKCGKPVRKHESATWLNVEAGYMNGVGLFVFGDRHIRCSPSRAQYIVHPDFGPVVDSRPEYDKNLLPEAERQEMTVRYTNAWLRLRKGEFPLVFGNWLHYKHACKFVADRHAEFVTDDRLMVIYFYSAENRDEMKNPIDILGWKCNVGESFIQQI